ncbi:hypothetical protein [Erythrobacter rubeus]|uniref:Uncharacterized protein n=1 Tax=Erythrobacter rubeus TaxID=2760803 RepID=A0ABR8KQB7_9SPHN|nr:hypothetical protein [Erythrobacter rubeus]MBD2841505.1 hypothetical protein [Erythrobacter rubeus]
MNTEISRLSSELEAAQADLELAERIKTARARVADLSGKLADAQAEYRQEQEEAAKAARAERLGRISNVRVTDKTSSAASAQGGVLHRVWQIDWDAPKWDHRTNTSPVGRHTAHGFYDLRTNVMEYLLDEAPEQIPAEILALCPGDPREAMCEYLAARRRGYTRGPAKEIA